MTEAEILALNAWLAEAGLQAMSEEAIIRGFAERFVASGAPLAGGRVLVDTLHPPYEGRAFRWRRGENEIVVNEYGPSSDGEAQERWRSTPFYRLQASGESHLVQRLDDDTDAQNPFLGLMRRDGLTQAVALVDRFGEHGGIGPADCLYSAWVSDAADGFRDADIEALRRLSPVLALALKAAGKARAKVAKLNEKRGSENLPVTSFYLGLHIGRVFYGNIGSRERLDFTVIGPAVNEVSRIASMCRAVDQPLLMSSAFVDGLIHRRQEFLSVGRFALRGVAAPQELFTVDPAVWPIPPA